MCVIKRKQQEEKDFDLGIFRVFLSVENYVKGILLSGTLDCSLFTSFFCEFSALFFGIFSLASLLVYCLALFAFHFSLCSAPAATVVAVAAANVSLFGA